MERKRDWAQISLVLSALVAMAGLFGFAGHKSWLLAQGNGWDMAVCLIVGGVVAVSVGTLTWVVGMDIAGA